jgi:hypothetical protein
MSIPVSTIYSSSSYSISMNCLTNNVTSLYKFGVSLSYTDEVNNEMQCLAATKSSNIDLDPGCSVENWANSMVVPACQGRNNCSITLDTSQLKSQCKFSFPTVRKFYLTYTCYSSILFNQIRE